MRRILLALYRVRGALYGVTALILVAIAFTSGISLGDGTRQARSIVAVISVGVLAVCVLLVLIGPRLIPTREAVAISAPVSGRWLSVNSPATKVPSHGIRLYGQAYAIDLVHEPDDTARPTFGSGSHAAGAGVPRLRRAGVRHDRRRRRARHRLAARPSSPI